MDYDGISDYAYVCCSCGATVEATGFFCGHASGLPDVCPECPGSEFIPRREQFENDRVNAEDAARQDERLYGDRT